ncbi:MFS transporter [Micrococcoides hystricis]|uniref:MFS transporter n=1 Tax=Micrococcoides hystricis TaxID=1572761 RepID=A0ABV6PBW3_9MICC
MSSETELNIFQRFARLHTLTSGWYLWLSGLARLPISMINIGTLTLVSSVTGSFIFGGIATAAAGLGNAIGGPIVGSIADRTGQRRVMNVTVILNLVALLGMLLAAFNYPEYSAWWMIAAAGLAGLSTPQVAPLGRARWMAVAELQNPGKPVHQRRDLDTALSFESTLDELGFALGPAFVGLVAGIFNPALAIVFAALFVLFFASAFANHPIAGVVHKYQQSALAEQRKKLQEKRADEAVTPDRWWTQIIFPVAGMVGQGTFFGATGVAVLAYTKTQGLGDSGGLLYGAMGLVSGFTALSVASWPVNFTNRARWLVSAVALSILTWILSFQAISPLWVVVLLLLLLGLPVGPTMVTTFSTVSEYTPPTRLATAMTVTQAGIVLGISVGNAVGGLLVQADGARGGFLLAAIAGTLIVVAATANFLQKRIYHHGQIRR